MRLFFAKIKDSPIKYQLGLLVSFTSLIPLILAIWLFSQISSKFQVNAIHKASETYTILASNFLDDFISQRVLDIKALSQSDIFEGDNYEAMNKYIIEIVRESNLLSTLMILDLEGKFITSSSPTHHQRQYLEEIKPNIDHLLIEAKNGEQGEVFVSEAMLLENSPIISLVTPITDDDNEEQVLLLVLHVSLESLKKRLKTLEENSDGFRNTYLVDNAGKVVISTDDSLAPLSSFPDLAIKPELLTAFSKQGDRGTSQYIDSDNHEVLVSFSDMSEFGVNQALDWSLVVTYQLDEVLNEARLSTLIILGTGIILVVIASLLAYVFGNKISSQLQSLSIVADRIGRGEQNVRAPESGIHELARVGLSLNLMLDRLFHLNETLEEKVIERTSQLKASQKHLIESEKLASLGALVAGISHEINTPIGIGVSLASSISVETMRLKKAVEQGQLKKSVLDKYFVIQLESSQLLLSNMTKANNLIKNFKQVAVDQSSSKFRRFNLKEHVDEIYSTLHHQIKNKPVDIFIDIPADIYMNSYPGPLSQVLINLMTNSLKHGLIPGKRCNISLSARKNNSMVTILHHDNGAGLSDEALTRLYEPFYTTKLGQGGSGLGLSIVHNIVYGILKGTITVSNQNGALFKLELPVNIDN